ncbi:MAG: serine/threonine protein kinase [Deltaproteobacteria bacterium]|nr:serine/threonine protein kinase [Deltaproteobacteria bacterium]
MSSEYRFVRELGVGGMSQVLLVEPEPGADPVAVKRLLPQLAGHPAYIEQLLAEGRRMQQLAGVRGVADVLAVVEPEDRSDSHLVMELVRGHSLARFHERVMANQMSCSVELALGLAMSLAETLDAVHRAEGPGGQPMDLVHRDVCPANLLIEGDDRLVLIDFGVASGNWPPLPPPKPDQGRVAYMAPEQAKGFEVDGRADLFSLGVILFELLAGSRLYGTGDRLVVLAKIMDGDEHRIRERAPECPADVADVIDRALALDREDRHFDAGELLMELSACAKRHGRAGLSAASVAPEN